jgi:Asp-tRNA(Asn)/Glu-tRNA(Gln) amidotransferase A subunit family amidase
VAITAPPLSPDAELAGASDQQLLEQLSAFSFAANLTGLPALSLPAGYDAGGLPVGLQLMGRHWQEGTLLRAGRVLERGLPARRPEVHFRLLP